MASGFPYTRLRNPQRDIRVLVFDPVHDVNDTAPLSCTLSTMSLMVESIEPYAAISYTWGDNSARAEIVINMIRVTIPYNTELALRYLHDESTGPGQRNLIWIDAICIDQSNNGERSDQVGIMSEVFARAHKVLAFSGPPHSSIPAALRSIQLLNRHVQSLASSEIDLHAKLTSENISPTISFEGLDLFALKEFYSTAWSATSPRATIVHDTDKLDVAGSGGNGSYKRSPSVLMWLSTVESSMCH